MPSYKLVYFEARGRAEVARLILHDAKVEFEDCRITQDDWHNPDYKASLEVPLGQVPMLLVDGKHHVPHSKAIYRHLARKLGYYGKNDDDALYIDVVCETCADLFDPMVTYITAPNDEEKAKVKTQYETESLPRNMKFLERLLENHSGGKGYFIGDNATLADLYLFTIFETVDDLFPGNLDKYPKVKANFDLVKSREHIAVYLTRRPETFF